MEQTLKVTNVLSDPTRYYIYQYITRRHKDVSVIEVAELFDIHPNVARLHLSKLEDVHMLVSDTRKTGKGGRPRRFYRLSDELIQLNFPNRDYLTLAKMALETMIEMGDAGSEALYKTGEKFGKDMAFQYAKTIDEDPQNLSFDHKLAILKEVSDKAGFSPEFVIPPDQTDIQFKVFNCPFKELAADHQETVCGAHHAFIRGMFNALFESVNLDAEDNMISGCSACTYRVHTTQ
ncbi:transcriptional regulator [Bacillus sp. FJAT-27916]|uniref:helix-turn-helix transcriptional regulator n=1 Tax=Bacillaceae TaxID=186817 RepID=UPI00067095D6|nr:helix-turn-helix domain-containing protein [Bacillus sp. FJAT-27916]KMY43773.1 transcriptional regulator [Bacillus sp. FJAT-27916]